MTPSPRPGPPRDPVARAERLAQDLLRALDRLPGLDSADRRRTQLRNLLTDLAVYRPPAPDARPAVGPPAKAPPRRRTRIVLGAAR